MSKWQVGHQGVCDKGQLGSDDAANVAEGPNALGRSRFGLA
ncbi:MAG: hypothetical protein ACFB5Z_00745 [Elainellaceae cyanobacterium]